MENKNLKSDILKGVKSLLVEQKTGILDKVDKKIDDLAIITQKGFNEIHETMATKSEVNHRFDLVDKRLDRIEKLILADHKERIEKLEVEVKELKDLLAFK